MYSCFITDLITGVIQAPVDPSKWSWSRVLNGTGSGTAEFQVSAAMDHPLDWEDLFTPWSRVFVVCEEGVVIYAGVITGADDVEGTNSTVTTIQHSDIRAVLDRRTTFGSNGYSGSIADGVLPLVNITYERIAAWLMWAGVTAPALVNPAFALPIFYPEKDTSTGGGTESRTYYDYQLQMIGAALQEIQNSDGGPDIDFLPYWTPSNTLAWQMRVGTTANPQLTGAVLDFNMTTSKHGLSDVKRTRDGSRMGNFIYAVGEGSEVDMKVASQHAATSGPALERVMQYKKIGDQGQLQSHADADTLAYADPTYQWSYTLAPESIQYQPLGTIHRLYYDGHVRFPDGYQNLRVIAWAGDETRKVTPTLQPIGATA